MRSSCIFLSYFWSELPVVTSVFTLHLEGYSFQFCLGTNVVSSQRSLLMESNLIHRINPELIKPIYMAYKADFTKSGLPAKNILCRHNVRQLLLS